MLDVASSSYTLRPNSLICKCVDPVSAYIVYSILAYCHLLQIMDGKLIEISTVLSAFGLTITSYYLIEAATLYSYSLIETATLYSYNLIETATLYSYY